MRVLRRPYSTNVERIALAAGHKGIAVEWVDVDPLDRALVREVSGQELVPVLVEDDGRVITDSPLILRRIEDLHPDPPLWPRGARARAEPMSSSTGSTSCGRWRRTRSRPRSAATRPTWGLSATSARRLPRTSTSSRGCWMGATSCSGTR